MEEPARHQPADKRTQTAALIVSMISAVVNALMNSSLNVALPSIGREFSMSAVLLGWIATAMLLSSCFFLVPFGRLADITGRKKIMAIGSAIFAGSSLLASFSTSGWMLIGARVVQGVGGAMIFGTGMAILTSVFQQEKKGWALGWNVSAVYFGLAAGPFVGGIMTEYWGWRSIFQLNAGLGTLSVILLVTMLKGEWADARGEKLDWPGSFLLGGMILSVIYGLMRIPSVSGFCLIGAGMVLFALFVRVESGRESPLVDIRLFRNRAYSYANLATLINYSAASSVGFLISLYLQYVKGFDPSYAGMILMAQPVVMVLFSPYAGKLSDRIDPGVVASIGMALTMVGLFLLAFLRTETELIYLIACLLIIGGGYALFSSPNTNAVMSAVERKHYGAAASIVSNMRQLGMMTGLALGTMMFSIFVGQARITPDKHAPFMTAIQWSFAISTILCLTGIFFSLARRRAKIDSK